MLYSDCSMKQVSKTCQTHVSTSDSLTSRWILASLCDLKQRQTKRQWPSAWISSLPATPILLAKTSVRKGMKEQPGFIHVPDVLWTPRTISGSRSFQKSTVSPCTSPDSPQIFNCLIANHFFHFSSHPCDPFNSGLPKVAAIIFAFSISCGPPTRIFLDLARTNHL